MRFLVAAGLIAFAIVVMSLPWAKNEPAPNEPEEPGEARPDAWWQVGLSGPPPAERPRRSEAERQRLTAEAMERWPMQSIVERLPKGKAIPPRKPVRAAATKRWDVVDAHLVLSQHWLAEPMQALHDKTRELFVEAPGVGSFRDLRVDDTEWFEPYVPETISQPGPFADFPISASEPLKRVEPSDEFYKHHEGRLRAFFQAERFGYVKDREHVAGFVRHGFSILEVSDPRRTDQRKWQVDHIHLVGILTQEQPVVYLTDKLPSMDQVRLGHSRPLDPFESTALESLKDGDDLSIVRKDDTIRMLGALRATKVCLQCHDANVGDLMGAFSYTLRPSARAERSHAGR